MKKKIKEGVVERKSQTVRWRVKYVHNDGGILGESRTYV